MAPGGTPPNPTPEPGPRPEKENKSSTKAEAKAKGRLTQKKGKFAKTIEKGDTARLDAVIKEAGAPNPAIRQVDSSPTGLPFPSPL